MSETKLKKQFEELSVAISEVDQEKSGVQNEIVELEKQYPVGDDVTPAELIDQDKDRRVKLLALGDKDKELANARAALGVRKADIESDLAGIEKKKLLKIRNRAVDKIVEKIRWYNSLIEEVVSLSVEIGAETVKLGTVPPGLKNRPELRKLPRSDHLQHNVWVRWRHNYRHELLYPIPESPVTDKQAAIQKAISDDPDRSDREIARDLAVSNSTVSQVRKQISHT